MLCVPWMLVAKPLVLRQQYLRRKHLVGDSLLYFTHENCICLKSCVLHPELRFTGSHCIETCKVFLHIPGHTRWMLLETVLPSCFPDLDPASNLLLKTPHVGNDQNSVSGSGFGSWFRKSLTGCWMHFCGWARLAVGNRDGIGWQTSQLSLLKQLGW